MSSDIETLNAELDDRDRVIERMRTILDEVARAVRGNPPGDRLWGWADLPEKVELLESYAADRHILLPERDELANALRPDLALAIHVKHCPRCAGPNDGCDLAQSLEHMARRGGWL